MNSAQHAVEVSGRRPQSFPPVYSVSNALEHALALWPGMAEGNPSGGKSVWPVPSLKNPERKVDVAVFVRANAAPEEKQQEIDGSLRFLQSLNGQTDQYISLNTFRGGRRRHANLQCLTGFVVDLDLAKAPSYGLDFMRMRQDALDTLAAAGVSTPTMAVHTGRGVHLYWLFDKYIPAKAYPRWKACMHQLITLLLPYGADTAVSDSARVLRLVGTHNSRAMWKDEDGMLKPWKVTAQVLLPDRQRFEGLCDQILPVDRAALQQKRLQNLGKAKKSRIPDLDSLRLDVPQLVAAPRRRGQTMAERAQLRLNDLSLLAKTRYPGGVPEGSRDRYVFHAACCLAWTCNAATLENQIVAWKDAHAGSWPTKDALAQMGAVIRRALEAYQLRLASAKYSLYDDRRYKPCAEKLWFEFGQDIEHAGVTQLMNAILPAGIRAERITARRKAKRQAGQADTYTNAGIRSSNISKALQALEMQLLGTPIKLIALKLKTTVKTIHLWLALPVQALGLVPIPLPAPTASYPQPLSKSPSSPKCSINNGVAFGFFNPLSSTGKGPGGSKGEKFQNEGKPPNLHQTIPKSRIVEPPKELDPLHGLGGRKTATAQSAGKNPQLSLVPKMGTSGTPNTNSAAQSNWSAAALELLRRTPMSEILKMMAFCKEDASYIPRKNRSTQRWHLSDNSNLNGGVWEVLTTGTKWYLKAQQVGGTNCIDFMMHITSCSFVTAVKKIQQLLTSASTNGRLDM